MADQQVFTGIYEAHYDKVFRLCKGYFNGHEGMAADATQEVFLKVWQHLAGFRGEAQLTTWLYRIAVNTCLSYLRKPSVKKEVRTESLPDLAAEPADTLMEERLRKMYGCIQQLQEPDKMIILMVLESIPYEAIATVMGMREATVRVRIHRIKKQLSTCVQL